MISIILPVFKNKTLVEYCLSNLERWLPEDAELIIVDDASGSETLEVLQKIKRAKLIVHDTNQGNTTAYNTGALAAQGDILVFMDSDIIIYDNSLQKLHDIFNSSDVDVVGTLLIYPSDNTIQHAGVAFDKWVLSHIYTGRKVSDISFEPIEERQAVTAAFFACRKSLFEQVGGFDLTYRDGLEDIDFCLKCQEVNAKIVIATDVRAFHFESASRGAFKSIRRTYNYSIFFTRWANKFEPDLDNYLKKSLSNGLVTKILKGRNIIAVNFCNTPNWMDMIQSVKSISVSNVTCVHNMSGFIAEYEQIDLFRKLPITFQQDTSTLLFTVDQFSQLDSNTTWFNQRKEPDIIIDRHANVLLSNYWNS